jgi:hypothetical protein
VERDQLVKERDRLDQDCAVARQTAQDAEHNILELQHALCEERGGRLTAEVELKAIRASRSWRITAPLRRFKRLLWPPN